MTSSPGDAFFGPWEKSVSRWTEALDSINKIVEVATPDRTMAWRGVHDASYSLHSSLYRRLNSQLATPPDEDQLLNFEEAIIARARQSWRFDNLSALETLAHIQHYGGPTRLLDVSYNPLIALWFAVEQKFNQTGQALPDKDGRVLAIDVTGRQVSLDETWGSRDVPWKSFDPQGWRRPLPKIWRPPSYNERIPAQNSAFLIGGVPMMNAGDNSRLYRKGPGHATTMGMWSIEEVRQALSVPVRMNRIYRGLRRDSTPTFTLRISASCKGEVRDLLEERFGWNSSTIYPDLFGMSNNVANGL